LSSNYLDVLGQLQAAGLLVDSLVVGRLTRCKTTEDREKRGWYHLHELRLDTGEDVIVGSFGIWTGNESNTQKVALKRQAISREQATALRQRLAADKKQALAARAAEAERAAQRARKAWAKCLPDGDCEYLHRKGIGAHGVRFSPSGAMVIPMLDTSAKIHGLQIIRGKVKGEARAGLEKEFWPAGLAKKGHFAHLGGVPAGVLLVAEGYATGASLFEATGLPVVAAFDAGNLGPVALQLRKRYKQARLLVCADDDSTQKCRNADCRKPVWLPDGPECPHCGQPHGASNAGVSEASTAAMQVDGAWLAPAFADEAARRALWLEKGRKLNDFNDLHGLEGLHVVRDQVQAKLGALGWNLQRPAARAGNAGGRGDACRQALRPIDSLDELLERYALVYGQGGTVFDRQEHCLVALGDMRDACVARELHRAWADHPEKSLVRVSEVGFDPAGTDPEVTCNLWAGWPTTPKAGKCEYLLDLLRYMCGEDSRPEALYQWVLRWLAYPIQHPGAKMKSTLVIHGPQGTGKNMFFEAIMAIYGRYGRVIDQSAIEDKFNDWASRKLFLIADEVVARSDLYHIKNKLKAFITGEWIRINPKNMAAYEERNHVNMVFLSNEAMPVVLEEDDRRHAVIWTPVKLSPDFYRALAHEIETGGIEALHHHLLHLDLGEFTAASAPPMTDAKKELIHLSKDSPSRFIDAFVAGDVEGFPGKGQPALLLPALSQDFYALYLEWCRRQGLKTLNQPRFVNVAVRKHQAETARKRIGAGANPRGVITLPGGHERPDGEAESDWLEERVEVFSRALRDLRGQMMVAA
jgi:putative DNA primase/helicase